MDNAQRVGVVENREEKKHFAPEISRSGILGKLLTNKTLMSCHQFRAVWRDVSPGDGCAWESISEICLTVRWWERLKAFRRKHLTKEFFKFISAIRRFVTQFSRWFTQTLCWIRSFNDMKNVKGLWGSWWRRVWWLYRRINESLNQLKVLSIGWTSELVRLKACCLMWVLKKNHTWIFYWNSFHFHHRVRSKKPKNNRSSQTCWRKFCPPLKVQLSLACLKIQAMKTTKNCQRRSMTWWTWWRGWDVKSRNSEQTRHRLRWRQRVIFVLTTKIKFNFQATNKNLVSQAEELVKDRTNQADVFAGKLEAKLANFTKSSEFEAKITRSLDELKTDIKALLSKGPMSSASTASGLSEADRTFLKELTNDTKDAIEDMRLEVLTASDKSKFDFMRCDFSQNFHNFIF